MRLPDPLLFRSGANTHCTRSLGSVLHLKFDFLTFFQTVKVEFFKAAAVKENLFPVRRTDKPETSIQDNPLDCPLHKHLA